MVPAPLVCVGATKAGTSWLYRTLSRHPGCAMRAVKEFHYWDTFDPRGRTWQVAAFRRREAKLQAARDAARAERRGRKVASLTRQVADLRALIAVVEGDRAGDRAYLSYLLGDARGRLAADITPGYGILSDEELGRMLAALPEARVLYLIRDPVARLWSHVRMQTAREGAPSVEDAASDLMRRILRQGGASHVSSRGDYPAAAEGLRRLVPASRLRIDYCERMFTPEGWDALQGWLGLDRHPADPSPAHEGVPAALGPDLAVEAARALKDHYDWAARSVGPLPAAWRASMEMA